MKHIARPSIAAPTCRNHSILNSTPRQILEAYSQSAEQVRHAWYPTLDIGSLQSECRVGQTRTQDIGSLQPRVCLPKLTILPRGSILQNTGISLHSYKTVSYSGQEIPLHFRMITCCQRCSDVSTNTPVDETASEVSVDTVHYQKTFKVLLCVCVV